MTSNAALREQDGEEDKPLITLAQEWALRNAPLHTAARNEAARKHMVLLFADSGDIAVDELMRQGLSHAAAEWLLLEYMTWLIDAQHHPDTLLHSIKTWLNEEVSR